MQPSLTENSNVLEVSDLKLDKKKMIRSIIKKNQEVEKTRNKPKDCYESSLSEIGLPSHSVREETKATKPEAVKDNSLWQLPA